jgi:hypothetical protein
VQVDRERLLEVLQEEAQNKLPYGTCRIVVSQTRVVQSIFGAIQEYAGFRRNDWLDA